MPSLFCLLLLCLLLLCGLLPCDLLHGCLLLQPIEVLRPPGLHWSAELRRQATASARERSKVESEMEAGSARCTPLPPKVRIKIVLSQDAWCFLSHANVFVEGFVERGF